MAQPPDNSLRPNPTPSRTESESPGRRSEIRLLDPPPSQQSALSVTASSIQSNDPQASIYQRSTSRNEPSIDHSRRGLSPSRSSLISPARFTARSIPAWVKITDESEATTPLFPTQPDNAFVASHHYTTQEKQRELRAEEGTVKSDAGEATQRHQESRWRAFTRSIAYPGQPTEETVVDAEWLNANFGDYSGPWQGHLDEKDTESGQTLDFKQRRKRWFKRSERTLLLSPIVPLIIRLTVFVFALIALALGGSIRYNANKYDRPQGPSADMAIIVDAIALVYLVYITYDEYMGKPLGLRPAGAKIGLIFLDLLFIVFASANLSLAFESLSDISGSCTTSEINQIVDPRNDMICERQMALASVLLIVLIAWVMTFTISLLRVVERVATK
ncbi:hypothetical protein FQN57_004432 [Myotisia sp. PD_48]|nr:hypothetical protein FQN57_004432 [Myotisia sp. PD_48]